MRARLAGIVILSTWLGLMVLLGLHGHLPNPFEWVKCLLATMVVAVNTGGFVNWLGQRLKD
jgi:hypothetical protein